VRISSNEGRELKISKSLTDASLARDEIVKRNFSSLEKKITIFSMKERAIYLVLFMCGVASIATTIGIIYVLLSNSVFAMGGNEAFFEHVSLVDFFTDTQWTPQYAEKHFGILPLLCGTFLIAGIAALIGMPLGLGSAVYLSEYASLKSRKFLKPTLELLAGIPTVVYGYFALVFVTPYILRPIFQDLMGFSVDIFNATSAGIVVGIMILPTVASMSEDALRAVPRQLREAGYALGSTKYDVSVRVILPAASSGVVASFMLAFARAIGETMAVTIAAGQKPSMTLNPFRSVETMTTYIVNVSLGDTPAGTVEYQSLYAVGLTLFCITLTMNLVSQKVLSRFREVYE